MRSQRAVAIEAMTPASFLHDNAALRLAHELLRPLLEGLALFTEFDTFPGKSEVWALPGRWAGALFLPVDRDHPEELTGKALSDYMDTRIRATLIGYRGSDAAVRRKTSVLMQALSDDHGHLSGYWAVKTLWFAAASQTPLFWDRDLFVTFLRDWVFQDWLLIDTLLDEELDASTTAGMISRRLQERLQLLRSTDLSTEVEAYNRDQGSATNDSIPA